MATTYETEWNGLTRGDMVKIESEQGDYKFIHAAVKDGVVDYIALVGGTRGDRQWRAINPERIKVLKKQAPKRGAK